MDNEKNTNLPDDSAWLDELLGAVEAKAELGVDEDAMASHDMSNISDREFEEIMREALAETFQDDMIAEVDIPIPAIDDDYNNVYEDDSGLLFDDEDIFGETPQPEPEVPAKEEPEEEAEPEEPDDPDLPVRKVRPKPKKGYGIFGLPHILSTGIWLVIAITIGVSLGRLLWVCAADVLAFGKPNQSVTITITEEEANDMNALADKLYDAGLIEYKSLFKLYATLAKADQKVAAGTYVLNTQYDYHALVSGMNANSSYRETVKVVIPEGYTCAQIYQLLESSGVCTVDKLEKYAAEEGTFDSYDFLEGVPRGSKYFLEGFLFPDTYEFYTNDTPQRIFDKMLSRFGQQFNAELRGQIDTLNERMAEILRRRGFGQQYIEEHKFTLYDVVILASIVQKESAHSGENHDIAGVFFNRITNPHNYPQLQSDATVVYALGGKQELTKEDLQVDSPYNTYHKNVVGLPIGPISNPGMFAIKAALKPSDHNYNFMLMDPSIGEHLLSETLQEHNNKVENLRK